MSLFSLPPGVRVLAATSACGSPWTVLFTFLFVINKLVLVYGFGLKPVKCIVWYKLGHDGYHSNHNSLSMYFLLSE